MPNLPLIGSIATVGGVAGVGGLALELSKPKSQHTSLTKSKEPSSLKVSKRCEIFHIQSTPNLTVKKVEESSLRGQVSDSSFWNSMDSDCKTKEKIYVASRDNKWVYDKSEQNKDWKVIP
ncbi:hypothetical protein HF1_03970 [Mycoplasma haemofelis str. Langford 1]|uniref:Uncharacterized protein n=1 Tax=Mycoplasma haemofelis (strain Langford 1) TaxID=941640 RepID=E8ZGY4_MYCHL|nr:hypothetical protein [Mycoplasma haemofelis]CBY92405.1 hypothetical protein HF1_03970 [Mycoplasma haemofelis str. Langford 1]